MLALSQKRRKKLRAYLQQLWQITMQDELYGKTKRGEMECLR
jgi:hypothetical protein